MIIKKDQGRTVETVRSFFMSETIKVDFLQGSCSMKRIIF
jgi:hypothetical protein